MPVELPTADVAAVRALARLARDAERALGGLSLAHYRVLSAVASGDARASRVAARLALGRPAVSASVEALSRRGLLSQTAVPDDQRVTALALTASGRTVLLDAETVLGQRLSQLCAGSPELQLPVVIDVLVRLGSALEAEAAQRASSRSAGAEAGAR